MYWHHLLGNRRKSGGQSWRVMQEPGSLGRTRAPFFNKPAKVGARFIAGHAIERAHLNNTTREQQGNALSSGLPHLRPSISNSGALVRRSKGHPYHPKSRGPNNYYNTRRRSGGPPPLRMPGNRTPIQSRWKQACMKGGAPPHNCGGVPRHAQRYRLENSAPPRARGPRSRAIRS